MAIEPIFEKITLSDKKQVLGEPVKAECKTSVATDAVSEVLSVSALSVVIGTDVSEGQIKYDGRSVFLVCYLAVDGSVKKTECSADFSGVIKDGCIKEGYKAVYTADTLKTEYDLTGSSLSVWASVAVKAELTLAQELSALSGGENIIIDTDQFAFAKSFGVKEGVYPLEEEFELSCLVQEVLCHRASSHVTSVSAGVGSIIVEGQVYLTVIALQKTEKCSIIKEVRNVPFRMEIECEDAMPAMQATATVTEKGLKTEILVDEENGKSKVSVSLNLHFAGEAWAQENISVARDAFSATDLVELVKEQTNCVSPREQQIFNANFNGRASTSELPVGVVLFAVGCERAETLTSAVCDGKLKVTGVITALGYFADGEGKPFTRKIETTFEKEFDLETNGEPDGVCVKAERVGARLVSSTEIELDGELIVIARFNDKTCFECIKQITSTGEKQKNTHAISVFIPLEDEELWSLAKRLNVCPTTLVETNPDLTFPLTGKERIVVYRKV